MARSNYSVLGAFIGRVGPVTGFMRNGRNVIRTSSSSIKDRQTPLQLAQRQKINVCNHFTRAFSGTGFFNKTFPAYGNTGTGYNRATSALMSRALTGVYPGLQLDYTKVLVSKGRLPGAQSAKVVMKANNTLQFSFSDNSTVGIASAGDVVMLVAYAPALQQAIFTLHGGFRKDKKAVLNVAAFKGQAIETWIGFLSANGEDAADSVWAGKFNV